MLTIKGRYEKGVVRPLGQIKGQEGQEVSIVFPNLEERDEPIEVQATDYDALTKIISECQMDTGIPDLAHQHDHYLHGTPKRPD